MVFADEVYAVVSRIPCGKVSTYKVVALALSVSAYRAVGQALRRNPYAPRVPCHRVIRNDGSVGGFGGEIAGSNIKRKIALLAKEGVRIEQGKVREEDILRVIPPI